MSEVRSVATEDSGPSGAERARSPARVRLGPLVRARDAGTGFVRRWWRWAPVPLGLAYLVLMAVHFSGVVASTYLDADTASAPVIAQLFGSAGPHSSIVLGTFGWYSTLAFDLATKWLPLHRQIWEGAPYAMALGAAALAAWSVWRVAGRWAAALTAVLMICAAPHTVHLLLSTTEHGPDWFCLALLGAYLVLLERRSSAIHPALAGMLTVIVGVVIGVNAASDALVAIAGVVPFVLAIGLCYAVVPSRDSLRAIWAGVGMLVVLGLTWHFTRSVMAGLHVTPQPDVHNSLLAPGDQVASNFKLWWQSIAVLGNGDFFGRELSFTAGLALICAALSITAVALLPRVGWRALTRALPAGRAGDVPSVLPAATPVSASRLALIVFWCSSAILLTAAFVTSATPVDIQADRYLVGLVYAAAAVIPVAAAGHALREKAAVIGTFLFALAGVISLANGTTTNNSGVALSDVTVNQVAQIAERNHLNVGYAGYWEAAPITWGSGVRVRVYPVITCNGHLCPMYLHYISSWYTPRPGIRSFLLTDTALPSLPAVPAGLGPPSAVYHLGTTTMYVYPYDLGRRIAP